MRMKSDFDGILRRYGHDVYVQKRILDDKGNISFSDTLTKYTVRHSLINNRALPQSRIENEEGITNTADRLYYFTSEANVYEGDRIYEDEPDAPGGKTVWSIDQVLRMKGNHGDLVYKVAGVTRIRPN